MEIEKVEVLNNTLDVIDSLVAAYNTWIWNDETANMSVVVDGLLELAEKFIYDTKAAEVIEEIIKTRNECAARMRDRKTIRDRINEL